MKTATTSETDFLLTGEVARKGNCSTDAVRAWERDGKLPAFRIGGQRVFRRSDVDIFLARRLERGRRHG